MRCSRQNHGCAAHTAIVFEMLHVVCMIVKLGSCNFPTVERLILESEVCIKCQKPMPAGANEVCPLASRTTGESSPVFTTLKTFCVLHQNTARTNHDGTSRVAGTIVQTGSNTLKGCERAFN
eukprot:5217799-Amphidinium_carterae.1